MILEGENPFILIQILAADPDSVLEIHWLLIIIGTSEWILLVFAFQTNPSWLLIVGVFHIDCLHVPNCGILWCSFHRSFKIYTDRKHHSWKNPWYRTSWSSTWANEGFVFIEVALKRHSEFQKLGLIISESWLFNGLCAFLIWGNFQLPAAASSDSGSWLLQVSSYLIIEKNIIYNI